MATNILNDETKNKNFLSNFAFALVIISLVSCLLAIIDYHIDLISEEGKGTRSIEFTNFLYAFNIIIIIGNLSYIGFAIHRYINFTKEKNSQILPINVKII